MQPSPISNSLSCHDLVIVLPCLGSQLGQPLPLPLGSIDSDVALSVGRRNTDLEGSPGPSSRAPAFALNGE